MDGFQEPVARNDLQKRLEANGFYCGDQCERTEQALRKFQAVKGLPETGVADSATWEKLREGDPDASE